MLRPHANGEWKYLLIFSIQCQTSQVVPMSPVSDRTAMMGRQNSRMTLAIPGSNGRNGPVNPREDANPVNTINLKKHLIVEFLCGCEILIVLVNI